MTDKGQSILQIPKTRFFYGYIIAIASFCILFIVYGVRLTYGVFFTPMAVEMGWNHATTSLAFSLSMLIEGVFNIIGGGLTDKYGPRLTISLSGILIGLGYCLIPVVHTTWQFYLIYAGIIGPGVGGIVVPLLSILMRWFKTRRILMSGIVMSGTGVGMLVLSPIADLLIKTVEWRTTFLILGILTIITVLAAAQLLKRDPSTMGLSPYGETTEAEIASLHPAQGSIIRSILLSYQFWFLFLTFLCFGYFSLSLSIHIVPDALKSGIESEVAALILAALGGIQIVGRVAMGLIGDRVGNKRVYMLAFSFCAVVLFFISSIDRVWAFFLSAIIFGTFQGGLGSSQPSWVANLFGLKFHGLLYGICGFGFTLGGALGPYITGQLFDFRGNYQLAFIICAMVSLTGLILTLFLRPATGIQTGTKRL